MGKKDSPNQKGKNMKKLYYRIMDSIDWKIGDVYSRRDWFAYNVTCLRNEDGFFDKRVG